MEQLTSQQLMTICDRFWIHSNESYGRYVSAITDLANRGPEIRDWCRDLLIHPDYDARETGAFLLGQLGNRRLLGDAEKAVVAELGALTMRPVEEDCKELQAIDSAISALAEIGDRDGIRFLRKALFTEDEWLTGDTRWNAAYALEKLVGESFTTSPNPVEVAKAWLLAHPAE